MRVLGIDIGSRSVDGVWLHDGRVVHTEVADTGFDPQTVVRGFVERERHDAVVATGYGRHGARDLLGCKVVTEIKAYALGAAHLFPQATAVLDIGGQDTKVIALGPGGTVADFEMNDKCAAGTGKFLEVMAGALGYSLQELADAALAADSGIQVSSMCTVFAESEVTGLVHRGVDRGRIARGLHESVVKRTHGALKRTGAGTPLVFAGGVANNRAMVGFLSTALQSELLIPESAQTVGALGAALSYGE